ncbi:MAG TPA: aldehyde dehydrogenase family protein [Solirubrobacteraceae bacterium]|jgi:1-pyrroline-5-carboxylate dehydrogenase|nr:aldehyde dehydrogenase family protein [Solirubrobacteraceae bacterium]
MAEPPKVTYETFTLDERQAEAFADAVEHAAAGLGERHPFYVNGIAQHGDGWEQERSPNDSRVLLGHFATASMDDFDRAVEHAGGFHPEWSALDWRARVEVVRRVSTAAAARRYELAAILAHEVGKPLLEALGEVDECAVLVDYYCDQMVANEGFCTEMGEPGAGERVCSVLRPYGVWAVIGPFNFPMALLLGPIAAALIAGNTVVAKPSPHGYLSGLAVYDLFRQAGVPPGALHLLTIPEQRLGERLYGNPALGGLTFTGSYATGMEIFRGFTSARPRPAICEMGGKNPAIVTASADLHKAALGISRSAFGFSGQRCSGCSRVLVARAVHDELLALLEEQRRQVQVASPLDPATRVGPVISQASVQRMLAAVGECRGAGWTVHGGRRLDGEGLRYGNYVEPALAEIPADARVLREELFTPFVGVQPVDSLTEALRIANGLVFGLTAGLYAEDEAEIERFVNEIHAGVVYVNREAGATTGAWPGIQPFGGWEGSGSTGVGAGGIYYLQRYMREQSRTFVGD